MGGGEGGANGEDFKKAIRRRVSVCVVVGKGRRGGRHRRFTHIHTHTHLHGHTRQVFVCERKWQRVNTGGAVSPEQLSSAKITLSKLHSVDQFLVNIVPQSI